MSDQILNLPGICSALELADVQEDRERNKVKRVFLGTVFALLPSGKFYTPWACSNVTEDEARKDQEYIERLEVELEEIGCFLESGEGDPCDLFAVKVLEEEE